MKASGPTILAERARHHFRGAQGRQVQRADKRIHSVDGSVVSRRLFAADDALARRVEAGAEVLHELGDAGPETAQPFLPAAQPVLAIRLEHGAEHAVERGIFGSPDFAVPRARQIKRKNRPVRDIPFRRLLNGQVRVAHGAFEVGEKPRERLLVVPHVRAIEGAAT